MNTQISTDLQRTWQVAKDNHWQFRVVGSGEMPLEPVYKDQWWYLPLTPDMDVPNEGKKRLEALRRAGVRIQGVIVAHESPKLLTTFKKAEKKPEFKITFNPKALTDILRILGQITSAFIAFTVWLITSVFSATLLIDPALIVVLESGEKVEVMTWYDSISS